MQLSFSEKEYEKILAMHSREDEKIVLEKEVVCTGGVENWLNTLLTVHRQSVGAAISSGLQSLYTAELDILSLIENSVLQVSDTRVARLTIRSGNLIHQPLSYIRSVAGRFISVANFMDARFRNSGNEGQTRPNDNETD